MRVGKSLLIFLGASLLAFALGTVIPPPRAAHGPPSFPQDDRDTTPWVGIGAIAGGLVLIGAGMRTASRSVR